MSTFDAVELIRTKRDGGTLRPDQIRYLLDAYVEGIVAEEQMSAMLMAICWRGLDATELGEWTATMLASGERLELSGLSRPTVDKHSTGGVGDKVSLILAPLVAACGAAVPQLSGRGLGHTGGTLDKLEAIAGWRASLSNDEILAQLESVGAVICAAGAGLAPADRRLYALRDVTGTVESIPLISASIMSKKLAEGTASLVLDVKVGSGAFMEDRDQARLLAQTMVGLGEDYGVSTVAVLTQMDTPLGRAVGNALEVTESIEVLAGGGPRDLRLVTLELAREMVALAGIDVDPEAVLDSGAAMASFEAMIAAQGGDLSAPLATSSNRHVITADRSGVLSRLEARRIGICAWRLGAGRAKKEDPVSMSAGVVCLVDEGDEVVAGQPLLELHLDDAAKLDRGLAALEGAITISDEPATTAPLLLERIAR